MEIIQDQKVGRLCLSRKAYIEKVLEKFGIHNAKVVSTLFVIHFNLSTKMSPQSEKKE